MASLPLKRLFSREVELADADVAAIGDAMERGWRRAGDEVAADLRREFAERG